MKKALKLIVSLALVCCCAMFVATGCKQEKEPVVSVDYSQSFNVEKGSSVQINATVTEDGAAVTDGVTWASSNAAVATVADGKVTGVAHGEADITLTYGEMSKVYKVTVYDRFIATEADFWKMYEEDAVPFEGSEPLIYWQNDITGWYLFTDNVTLSVGTVEYFDAKYPGHGHEINYLFYGRLDGDGHTLVYKDSRLFSKMYDAVIEDITLIASDGYYWGPTICFEAGNCTFRNVHVDTDFLYQVPYVYAGFYIGGMNNGGFVYYGSKSTFENCSVRIDVSRLDAYSNFGAFVGYSEDCVIKDSKATVIWKDDGNTVLPMPAICNNVGDTSTVENTTVTQTTVAAAKYRLEYYLQNDDGEFVLDTQRSADKMGPVGRKLLIPREGIIGHHIWEDYEKNIEDGVVTEDGKLVMRLYYKQDMKIKADIPAGNLAVDATHNLNPVLTFEAAEVEDATFTFASSDATIATVSATGVVTAVKAGEATITITASTGTTLTVTIKVGAPAAAA